MSTGLSINDEKRLSLTFKAVVQVGEGRFSNMAFPGRGELKAKPECWPIELQPGSLNCKITEFPDDFYDLAGEGDRIEALDHGRFKPEFRIPRQAIKNNVVRPYDKHDNQEKGIAQVWRCLVTNEDTGQAFEAFHVRRIDGSYPPFHGIMELMSDKHLRDCFDLKDGTNLTIKMFNNPAYKKERATRSTLSKITSMFLI
jgi:hypothetical protein